MGGANAEQPGLVALAEPADGPRGPEEEPRPALIGRLLSNSGFLFLSRLSGFAVSLAVTFAVAWHHGPDGLGRFSFVIAFLTLFQLGGSGFDQILVREFARGDRDNESLLRNAVAMRAGFGAIMAVTAVVVAWILRYDATTSQYLLFGALSMPFGAGMVLANWFQARLRAGILFAADLGIALLQLTLLFVAWSTRQPLLAFVLLAAWTSVLQCIAYGWARSRVAASAFGSGPMQPSLWRDIWQWSWPMLVSYVFISLNLRIDQALLFTLRGEVETGHYAAVVKLVETLNFVPVVLMGSLYPLLCRLAQDQPAAFTRLRNATFLLVGLLIMPVPLLVTAKAGWILERSYGSAFLAATPVMAMLIWSEVFVFLGIANSHMLTATGLQRYITGFTMAGAGTNIVLNLMLIPPYGAWGSAVATVISYSGLGLLLQYAVPATRPITQGYFRHGLLRPLVPTALLGGALAYGGGTTTWAAMAGGTMAYILCAYIVFSGEIRAALHHAAEAPTTTRVPPSATT